MKRRSFRFLTFIISVLVSSTSLFVMPVSAEEISLVPQKAQYEVDNDDYRAKIDEFYGYIPLVMNFTLLPTILLCGMQI